MSFEQQSRSWRRRLVLNGICLGCSEAGYGSRRAFCIGRIRAEGLNMCELEPCPIGSPVWHRRRRRERPESR